MSEPKNATKVIALVLIMALLGAMFGPQKLTLAQAGEPKPEDFFLLEFLGGLAGAYAGGVAGAFGVKILWESGEEGLEEHEPEEIAVLTLTGLGLGIGAGATTGVVVTGLLLGVNGNLLFAPLGAGFGVINSFGLIYLLGVQEERELSPLTRTIILITIPAVGAAVGYNIGGAKMRAKSRTESMKESNSVGTEMKFEFTLPLFKVELEF